MKVVPETCRAD